jgi:hypothetical protein
MPETRTACPHCIARNTVAQNNTVRAIQTAAAVNTIDIEGGAALDAVVSEPLTITAMQVIAVGPYLPLNRPDLLKSLQPLRICLDDLRGPAGGYWEVRPTASKEPFIPVYFGRIDENGYFEIPPNVPVSPHTVPGSSVPVKGSCYISLNPMNYPLMLVVCGRDETLPEVPVP